LVLFLRNALEPEAEEIMITGSKKCGECHSLKMYGDQQTPWENSAHRKAYYSLSSEKSTNFASSRNIQTPINNPLCLKCHTTEFSIKESKKTPTYFIDEGVGCESCHGAGSGYSPTEIMESEELFKSHGGEVGNEETCRKCHSPKGNPEQKIMENVCPFQKDDFIYKTAFEKIKHPVNRENFKK
jgi:hypothetical protein